MSLRPLILIGIQGKLPTLLPKKTIKLSPNRAVVPIGTYRRKENDHVQALELALNLKNDDVQMFVREANLELKKNHLSVLWEEIKPNQWERDTKLGEVWVEPSIANTYKSYFDFTKKKNQHFFLNGTRLKQSRLRGLTSGYSKMVGRVWELKEIKEILDQSFEDRGQIVSILGEGGLGKTRLYVDFEKYLEEEDILYYKSQFQLKNNAPYSAFKEIFTQLIAQKDHPFDLTEIQKKILNHLLKPEQTQSWIASLETNDLTQNIFELTLSLLDQLQSKKIAFILDDMHWADQESIELVHRILPSIPSRNHMWLLIHRPEFKPNFLRALFYHRIELKPLDRNQIEEQCLSIHPFKHIAPTVIKKIERFSKGNPFFIEEFFRHAYETGSIKKKQETLTEINLTKQIPMNIRSMIHARLDQLPSELIKALSWLCMIGSEIRVEEAEIVLAHLGLDSNQILNTLIQESYIVEISAFPDKLIGFYHDIIFETLRKDNISAKRQKAILLSLGSLLQNHYGDEKSKYAQRISEYYIESHITPESYGIIHQAAIQDYHQSKYSSAVRYFSKLLTAVEAHVLIDYPKFIDACLKSDKTEHLNKGFGIWEKLILKKEDKESLLDLYDLQIQHCLERADTKCALKVCRSALAFIQDNKKFDHKKFIFWIHEIRCLNQEKNQQPAAFSKSLFSLRALNGIKQNTYKSILFRNLYHFAIFLEKEPLLGLDFIKKGINATSPDEAIDVKTYHLKGYAFFITVHKCNYSKSVRVWDSLIQERKSNGLLSNIESYQAEKNVSLFFLGRYDRVIENYKKIEHIAPGYSLGKSYASQWLALTYQMLGDFDASESIIKKNRYTPITNPYLSTMKLYVLGMHHFLSSRMSRAIKTFDLLEKMYRKKSMNQMANDIEYMNSVFKLGHCPGFELKKAKIVSTRTQAPVQTKNYNYWAYQIYDLVYQAHNPAHTSTLDDIVPSACPNAFLKQRLYVEKIKYLYAKGYKKELTALQAEYKKVRQDMAIFVPDEFQESFLRHPTLGVPCLN